MRKSIEIKGIIILCLFLIPLPTLFSQITFGRSNSTKVYQQTDEYKNLGTELPGFFTADEKAIFYTGKIDFKRPEEPLFAHAGVSIKTEFEGSGIDAVFEDFGNKNYYLVIIDNKTPLLLHLEKGKHTYTLARNLFGEHHSIEIFKRTEANCGASVFYGFALEEGKKLIQPRNIPSRKMLFIGDSITAGYGNDRKTSGPPVEGFFPRYENHYNSYGAITARKLNSLYEAVCYSGIGMIRDYGGGSGYVMPKVYRQIAHGSSARWNPEDYVPDIVVINLGSNDYFSEIHGKSLNDRQFRETYREFVSMIRSDYPEARIICAVGCMINDNWPPDAKAKTRLSEGLKEIVADFNNDGDGRVYYWEVNVSGEINGDSSHPTTANHMEMSASLVKFCRKIAGW